MIKSTTRKGRIQLFRPDGTKLSEHNDEHEVYEHASRDARERGQGGTYLATYPPREIEIEVPQAIQQPPKEDPSVSTPQPEQPRGRLCADLTFEGGRLGWRTSGNPPEAVFKHGRWCMWSVLDREKSPVSYRTEITADAGHPERSGRIGHNRRSPDTWLGMSIYMPSDWLEPSTTYEIIGQWHGAMDPDEGTLNPCGSIHVMPDGEIRYLVIGDSRRKIIPAGETMSGKTYEHRAWLRIGHVTDWVGRWVNIEFRARFGFLPVHEPLIQIWVDDVLVAEHEGPNCFNDTSDQAHPDDDSKLRMGPYLKLGLYKGWHDRTNPPDPVKRREIGHSFLRLSTDGSANRALVMAPRYEDFHL